MISIKDVKCEYVTKLGDCIPTEDLQRDWSLMSDEQKQGWFTTVRRPYRVNADTVIEHILDDMDCDADGYDEMSIVVSDSCIDNESKAKLQKVLDEIFSGEVMDVYYSEDEIVD